MPAGCSNNAPKRIPHVLFPPSPPKGTLVHTTGRAATNRLNLAQMEDLVRLAHTTHMLT